MLRISLLCSFALLAACSTGDKGVPLDTDDSLPGGDTDGGGDTDTVDTDTDDTEFTGNTPADACIAPPLGGPIAALGDCEYVPNPTGTLFSAQIEWSMTQPMVDPATGALTAQYVFAHHPDYASVYHAPNLVQATDDNLDGAIDDEDIPDIAAIMAHPDERADGVLRLVSGDGTAVHATTLWSWHTNGNGTEEYAPYHYAGLATGDIDGDGNLEVATLVTRKSDGPVLAGDVPDHRQPGGRRSHPRGGVRGRQLQLRGAQPGPGRPRRRRQPGDDLRPRGLQTPTSAREWYGSGGRGWYGRADYPYPDGYWNSGYHAFAYDMDGDGTELEVVAGRSVYNSDGSLYCELGSYLNNVLAARHRRLPGGGRSGSVPRRHPRRARDRGDRQRVCERLPRGPRLRPERAGPVHPDRRGPQRPAG